MLGDMRKFIINSLILLTIFLFIVTTIRKEDISYVGCVQEGWTQHINVSYYNVIINFALNISGLNSALGNASIIFKSTNEINESDMGVSKILKKCGINIPDDTILVVRKLDKGSSINGIFAEYSIFNLDDNCKYIIKPDGTALIINDIS